MSGAKVRFSALEKRSLTSFVHRKTVRYDGGFEPAGKIRSDYNTKTRIGLAVRRKYIRSNDQNSIHALTHELAVRPENPTVRRLGTVWFQKMWPLPRKTRMHLLTATNQ